MSNITPPPATPHITLSRATESDLPALVAVQFKCFSHSVLVEQIVHPDTPASRVAMIEEHREHMRKDPGLQIAKVIAWPSSSDAEDGPGEGGRIIGFGMFYFPTVDERTGEVVLPIPLRARYTSGTTTSPPPCSPSTMTPTDSTPQENMKPSTSSPDTSDSNTTALTPPAPSTEDTAALFDSKTSPISISISRTNIHQLLPHRISVTTPLLATSSLHSTTPGGAGYVRAMCVSPEYRRHGIGRRLMEWGLQRYDERMVDVYLESTPGGVELYQGLGFEVVGGQVITVDGVPRVTHPCMWRRARGGGKNSRVND